MCLSQKTEKCSKRKRENTPISFPHSQRSRILEFGFFSPWASVSKRICTRCVLLSSDSNSQRLKSGAFAEVKFTFHVNGMAKNIVLKRLQNH